MGINITAGSYRDGAYWQNSSATAFTADDAATLAKTWKFNTVRLNVNSVANPNIWFDAELDRVIGLLTDAGIVAMVENHPFGTGFDPTSSQITTTAQGFATLAKRWADNPCVWFNPYNEPGGKLNASVYHVNATDVSGNDAWVDWHVPVIDAIRAKSEHAVIVLDDTHFGQARAGNRYDANQSASLVYGPGLNQKFDNLVYSVHFYDRWGGSKADLGSFFASAKAKGLAIVAGEAGGHPTLGPWYVQAYWPTATALFQMRQPGVGILLWHGNQGYQSGMSVGRDFGRRTAVWDVTTRSDTEASGTLLWDWTHNPPSATP